MANPYLKSLEEAAQNAPAVKAAADAGGEDGLPPSADPDQQSKKADEPEDATEQEADEEKVAEMVQQDLCGRVAGQAYLAGLQSCGVEVNRRVDLTTKQAEAAGEGAALAVRAVTARAPTA